MASVDVDTLPKPVRSYARRAIPEYQDTPEIMHIRQHGEIRMKPDSRWQTLTADQYFSVHEPGFFWLAKVKVAPLINIVVTDSYVNGDGYLTARLLGSIPLVSAVGAKLDQGELMRYIAELVWNPVAIFNNPHLQFTMIDDHTVTVNIDNASVDLFFDKHGDIVRIHAPDRPRTVGKDSVPTVWEGEFFDYTRIGAYRIPKRGEVAWLLEEGTFTYWRGEIIEIKQALKTGRRT